MLALNPLERFSRASSEGLEMGKLCILYWVMSSSRPLVKLSQLAVSLFRYAERQYGSGRIGTDSLKRSGHTSGTAGTVHVAVEGSIAPSGTVRLRVTRPRWRASSLVRRTPGFFLYVLTSP